MIWTWDKAARYVEEELHGTVNWDKRFFICPQCGDPIYEDEWKYWWPWIACPVCHYDIIDINNI